MTSRTVIEHALVATVATVATMIAAASPRAGTGQQATGKTTEPQVAIVQTVGCVEQRGGDAVTWWLTRAADPTESRAGVFNVNQVDEAKETALGSGEFQLVGVADFLTAEGLLRWGDRAQFTSPEQVNATGELREGRTMLVKGLLIEADAVSRINLLAVIGLANTCG